MKANAIVSALVAMSLGLGGPVLAQPNDPPGSAQPGQRSYQRPAPRGPHQRPDLRQPAPRGWQQPGPRAHTPPGYHYPPPGARPYGPPGARIQPPPGAAYPGVRGVGPGYRYYRGDRLPLEYRTRHYVIDDWRPYGLYAPPRGYHWVQVGADYVLVAIATGIILELLLHN
jgi:Ni/Co efflux regulator RcnB